MFFNNIKFKISRSLHRDLTAAAQAAGYARVEELIQHVLEREVEHLRRQDEEQVRQQLRGLGYLD